MWHCFFFGCQMEHPNSFIENTDHHKNPDLAPFYHGVASGDPDQHSVIIWTRLTPSVGTGSFKVRWEMSENENFGPGTKHGEITTDRDKDFTCKVLVGDLQPGTYYYYRFTFDHVHSAVGRTKTASLDASQLRFAVASCSNYEWGYFNAYRAMADELSLDAILHLGDYIYEYGIGRYGDTTIGRLNIPPHEIISLQDYRDRYALYRLDPDLQAAHQFHPFITIWDDHEITNNAYKDGAENHQEDEGSYANRKATAKRVYGEWMPIRDESAHYRKISYGGLVDLLMLDERLAGRSQQADSIEDPRYLDEQQTMLGKKQLHWLEEQLQSSEAIWKLIGNQVIFSRVNNPSGWRNLDAWDGYPVEQSKVANIIQANGIENVVFLTGDTHASWAFEVSHNPLEDYEVNGGLAIEFGTTSINSANSDERNHIDSVRILESKLLDPNLNPHLKFNNMRDHGYLALNITGEGLQADFIYVNTVKERSSRTFVGRSFGLKAGSCNLEQLH